uniref:hypothetical protein n=1 Tax=Enterocloster clostridioformis TaxID=1531 RepID=UPI0026F32B6E|nr:hypothetical protein [Enterocloster clostridioformis]
MIRQISVGNLCGELGEMLIHFQYSSDSLRRYNKVFDEFTEYAGEREYSQQLGAAIRTLAEYYNFGVIFRRQDFRGEIIWPEPFRECTEKFLLSKVEYGVCYGYVKHCRTSWRYKLIGVCGNSTIQHIFKNCYFFMNKVVVSRT